MITKLESIVPEGIMNMEAAAYLVRAYPMIERTRLKRLIAQRQLKINSQRVGGNTCVKAGDRLTLYFDGKYDMSLSVIYSDDRVISFIKPRGLPVDADEDGIGEDTALNRLRLIYPGTRLVHRLDAGTSGVMLAAASAESEKELTNLFKEHLLTKKYTATVIGSMPKRRDKLHAYLTKRGDQSKVYVSDTYAKGAYDIETHYSVKSETAVKGIKLTRLEIIIPTGRTHQIRAHMAHIGHPLLGDDKYGDRGINKLLGANETDLTSAEIIVKDEPGAGAFAGMRFRAEE